MLSLDAESIPVGRAVYTGTELASSIALSGTPAIGVVLPAAADSAIVEVSGADVYANFQAATSAASTDPSLKSGKTYMFVNQRTALVNARFIRSAAGSRLDIWYFSAAGR